MSFQSTRCHRVRYPRPALQAREKPRKRRKPDDVPAGQGQARGPPREKLGRQAPTPDLSVHPFGRTPSLVELRESALEDDARAALGDAIAEGPVLEVYLRVALSTLAPFAAVQEVRLTAAVEPDGAIVLTEAPRAGIFEPSLLKRLQLLVGVLAERNIRHLDFGEIVEPPEGFDPGSYPAEYGGLPGIANYLFYPQPPAAIATTTLT